jgi:hypothetical protein
MTYAQERECAQDGYLRVHGERRHSSRVDNSSRHRSHSNGYSRLHRAPKCDAWMRGQFFARSIAAQIRVAVEGQKSQPRAERTTGSKRRELSMVRSLGKLE